MFSRQNTFKYAISGGLKKRVHLRKTYTMKKGILMLGLCLTIISCKQENKEIVNDKPNDEVTALAKSESEKVKVLTSEMLVPMEIVKEKSQVVTEKYGIDFNGTCYACDVANIIVDGEMITLMNACDAESQVSFKITSIEENDNAIIVHTPTNTFEFTQVETQPIYSLTVKGNATDVTVFRTAKFYTVNSLLKSFEVHDCGEFEG